MYTDIYRLFQNHQIFFLLKIPLFEIDFFSNMARQLTKNKGLLINWASREKFSDKVRQF